MYAVNNTERKRTEREVAKGSIMKEKLFTLHNVQSIKSCLYIGHTGE